jgi:OOP family OmpA-OmpF porin
MSHSNPHSRTVAHAAVLLLLPLAAWAQNTDREGYLLDGRGDFVHSATPGQCWHTGEWTPALAQQGCDPLLQKAAAPPAPVLTAAAPMEAAPVAPAPAPVAIAAPAAVPPQTVSLSSDVLFGFDKATLGPKGKEMLDQVSVTIRGLSGGQTRLVGHADRLGSNAYNQKLSTQRAYAVRDYLAFKGVPLDRLQASGVGETDPLTKPDACPGGKSARLIACLQPDRRVDVEMQGTRTATPP